MSEELLGVDVDGLGFIGHDTGEIDEAGQPVLRWWSIGRLWKLADALPVEEVPLEDLAFVLDEPSNFVPSLGGQKMRNRDVAEKAKRIFDADLAYPAIMAADGWLMDGYHRIMKAWALGYPTIRLVRFAPNPPPDYVCDSALLARERNAVFF